jgi:chromosome partitioning protein
MTMYDSRTNLSAQVESEASKFFPEKMFTTRIPRNIRLSECPSHGLPISLYDPQSAGAKAYKQLTDELLVRMNLVAPTTSVLQLGNG